jgi:magnesium chelatase subunit D
VNGAKVRESEPTHGDPARNSASVRTHGLSKACAPAPPSDGRATRDVEARAADVSLAMSLWAVDPAGLGGVTLRSAASPVRDAVCAWLPNLFPRAPIVRAPLGITEDRLLGGLSLADTLRAGKVVRERGLLARADGGVVIAAMAERLEPMTISRLCAALDEGVVRVERDGASLVVPTRLGVLALDEGEPGSDEATAPALRDRLAFRLELDTLRPDDLAEPTTRRPDAAIAPKLVGVPGAVAEAIVMAATAFGVVSLRAPLLAIAAARAHAALHGRSVVDEVDAQVAVRLVLGHRATRLPAPPADDSADDAANDDQPDEQASQEPETDTEDQPQPPEAEDGSSPEEPERPDGNDDGDAGPPTTREVSLEDVLVSAVKSGLPPGLLQRLMLPNKAKKRGAAGRVGAATLAPQGGRPAGVRAGALRHGERLHVLETIRAAAPWQRVRQKERPSDDARRVLVRSEDFRVVRTKRRSETCVIFCVDASGSLAMKRLAEVKGAVEQVLLECYARRDHVALIAFRGEGAQVVLPPMRALARVRKGLAGLVGGGPTPLAAGLDAALAMATEVTRRGQSPLVVVLTDGRGNVAKDGSHDAAVAAEDARTAAVALRVAGVRTIVLDTSPRPRPITIELATAMDARYLPLPYLDAAVIARQVQSIAGQA